MKSILTHIFSGVLHSHNETGKRLLRVAVDQQQTRNQASDAQEASPHFPPPISPQDPIFLVEIRVGVGFAAHQASHPTTHPARILLPLLVGVGGGYLAPHQSTHLPFFSRRRVFCRPGSWAHSKEQPMGRQVVQRQLTGQQKDFPCLEQPKYAWDSSIYTCGRGIIINNTPVYSPKCLSLNNKVYSCSVCIYLEESGYCLPSPHPPPPWSRTISPPSLSFPHI